jgi:hypothetical protein
VGKETAGKAGPVYQTKRRGKNMSMSLRRKITGRRRSISKSMTKVITRTSTRKKMRCWKKTSAHRTPVDRASA